MSSRKGLRGPKTKEGIKTDILLLKKNDVDGKLSAKDIRRRLLKIHLGSKYIPKERAIYNIIQKNKEKIIFDPIDSPWSIGSCEKYNIPADIIPTLINEQQTRVYNEEEKAAAAQMAEWAEDAELPILTIRKAKWFAILHPVVNDLIERKYTTWNSQERQACLSMLVDQYTKREQEADLMGSPIPDTSDLDEKYFLKEDLSLGSIGEGFAETFLPKQKGLGRQIRESIEESEIARSAVVNSDKMNPSQKEGDGGRAKKKRNSNNLQSNS